LLVAVLAPGRGRAMTLATLALAYAVIMASAMVPPARILDPRPALRTFRDSVAAALLPDRRNAAIEAVRAKQRELYGIDPPILAALRGHTVHVDPTQTAVLHAYPDLAWRPLPVFQAYSAYTPGLDALNAEAVRGPEAPDRILREAPYVQPGGTLQIPVTIDGRFRWWDQPATTLEIWCRYEEVAASARWQVLARTDRRCDVAQPLATIESGSARTVDVPEAPRDRFLVVRIRGLEPSALDQLGTVLFKPLEWYALLGGVRYRLVQTTAADGLLLAVPPGDEGSAPFAFGPPIRTLRIESAVLVPLRFEFFTVARSP
jgi:hypothetical protein